MSSQAPLRVACVGAGYFAQFHYDSWARIAEVTQVGACDRDLPKARATGLPAFADLDTMLDATRPDLLDVILPPSEQAAAIRSAIAAGVRHIICQKPFCRDLDEAKAVTSEAEREGVILVIHENFRFQPWYRAIKRVLEDHGIGEVQQITFRLRPGDGQGPDAYLDRQPYFRSMPRFLVQETAVHWIDTFRYLLGNPTAVYADLRRLNPDVRGEDAGYILFDFPGGARGIFDANRHLDHGAANLRCTMGEGLVEGTEGTLSLHGDGSVWRRAFGTIEHEQLVAPDTTNEFGGDCVHHLQSHVVARLTSGKKPVNVARDYLIVRATENAIYASALDGKKKGLGPWPIY